MYYCKMCRLADHFDDLADNDNLKKMGWDTDTDTNSQSFARVSEEYKAQYGDVGFNNAVE